MPGAPHPVTYAAASERDLGQILDLQRRNVEEALSPAEAVTQGFVTVRHDLPLLRDMNRLAPHVVARSGDRVVGYALVMLRAFEDRIPILGPMYDKLGQLDLDGRPVDSYRYFIMGQICVDEPQRGSGVFAGMYHKMRELYSTSFDMTITEIAVRNTRSIRAHDKVGFRLLHRYRDPDHELWDIVVWDWRGA